MSTALQKNEDILGITEKDVAIVPNKPDPMILLQSAIERNWDLERLSQLMGLQERWQANEARMAFEDAMAAFKAEHIVLLRDKLNKQYQSKYISIGNLVGTVTPYLSKHGLSATWDQEQNQNGSIKITCTITHRLGHSRSSSIVFPPDKSGSKNPLQEVKSAITYGRVCTFEGICGLASSDANLDDDGNGATTVDVTEWVDYIKEASSRDECRNRFEEAYKKTGADANVAVQKELIAAKDARMKGFGRANY